MLIVIEYENRMMKLLKHPEYLRTIWRHCYRMFRTTNLIHEVSQRNRPVSDALSAVGRLLKESGADPGSIGQRQLHRPGHRRQRHRQCQCGLRYHRNQR